MRLSWQDLWEWKNDNSDKKGVKAVHKEIRASVAMAVYNGEKYIEEQLDSIVEMLGDNDEIVISYDESTDKTYEIICRYRDKDSRIKVVCNSNKSVESNFNNAVEHCSGKYIFLADQDDVWIADKINLMVSYMQENPKVKVLISDGYITDENLTKKIGIFEEYNTSASAFRNFVKGTYLGCQMAFSSDIKNYVWPVKTNPPLPHDLWLGVMGARYGKVELMDNKTILHRIHEENYTHTSKMKLLQVIKNRWLFLCEIIRRSLGNKREKSV